ncbi:metallophosphoesterase [Gleimia sp. 6138-11-ORH1]|uniref:metallophosphoesterase n=1 Tax=Gleimia sp. 6138-11-ORH1 TaxID=2973937 RepID=UPI00216779F3|nr:metallophosphoesterase [Gleimia sp. 6138-11-ORH1]MCS4484746.1 metallophosphoesterase [Gleimia sp. 6138-11-ORH1]
MRRNRKLVPWLKPLAGLAVAGLGALAWTQLERRWPALREYTIEVPGLTNSFTILQVADPHFYPGQEWLVAYFHELAELDFDFVVATGDNFGSLEALEMVEAAFEPLLKKPGAFVFGSNDYYSPLKKSWTRYLRKNSQPLQTERTVPDLPWEQLCTLFTSAGWINANNASGVVKLPATEVEIRVVGVDDPHIKRDRFPADFPQFWEHPNIFKLGLTHAPYQRILNEFAAAKADLVLAGHTHGGQLALPFIGALVTNCDLPRQLAKGLFLWKQAAHLLPVHVSAGLGTSPFAPVRFACRPEATLLHLIPES